MLSIISNECTHSAEPSSQVWFGKQEWCSTDKKITADNILLLLQLLYWDYIIMRLYYNEIILL